MKAPLTFIAAIVCSSISTANYATESDRIKQAKQDTKIMSKILETTNTTSKNRFPRSIEAQYLKGQGYVFQINGSRYFSFSTPTVPTAPLLEFSDNWEAFADHYAAWGEKLAEQATESVEIALAEAEIDFDDMETDEIRQNDQIKQLKREMKSKLKALQSEARKLNAEQRKHNRELEHKLEKLISENEGDFKKREQEIEKLKAERDAMREAQRELHLKQEKIASSYKSQLLEKQEKTQNERESALLSNFCIYSNSLRYLNKNEHVTFIFKNADVKQGQDKIYVFDYNQVQNCQEDGDNFSKILSNVTQYYF